MKGPEDRSGGGTAAGRPARSKAGGFEEESERRACERHLVEGVQGIFLSNIDARVVNLSLDGIAVETNHYLQVGREYALKLNRGDENIPLRGSVVWCSLVRTTKDEKLEVLPVYRAGIHFEQALSGPATNLHQFIEENAVISLEKRLFGRFKTKSDESADVQYEARFVVRQLSQSGMQIQTDVLPAVDSSVELEMILDSKLFQAAGRIVHAQQRKRQGEQRLRVEVGIEFPKLSVAAQRTLDEFIGKRIN